MTMFETTLHHCIIQESLDMRVLTRTVGALLHITNNLICVGRGLQVALLCPALVPGCWHQIITGPRSRGRHEAEHREDVTIFLSIYRLPGYEGDQWGCGEITPYLFRDHQSFKNKYLYIKRIQ